MNLTALPAFAKNRIWMIRGVQHAVVPDAGVAIPAVLGSGFSQPVLPVILVTHHPANHPGSFNAVRPTLKSRIFAVQPTLPKSGGLSGAREHGALTDSPVAGQHDLRPITNDHR